jgi:uncharacterized protein YkvS
MSFARRHFQRVVAGAIATTAVTTSGAAAPVHPLQARMLALLTAQQLALKQMQSVKAKIAAKVGYVVEYEDYVAGILDADAGGDDAVLVTIMVWRLDIGAFGPALDIAEYALRHNLQLPERFDRTLACLVLEETAEAALNVLQSGETLAADLVEALPRALELTADADMPDQVRAKAFKALGLIRRETDPAAALAHLRQALSYDKGTGVKTEIARLEKQLAAAAPPPSTPPAAAATPPAGT